MLICSKENFKFKKLGKKLCEVRLLIQKTKKGGGGLESLFSKFH